MQSDLQKVMHPILGKPIVQYVAEAAKNAGCDDITVVVGADGEEIKRGLGAAFNVAACEGAACEGAACEGAACEGAACQGIFFATQDVPLGTGHAVQAGAGRIQPNDDVLILCGDMPLVTSEFIRDLVEFGRKNPSEAIVAAVFQPAPTDFGRVYDANGDFIEIVEARDLLANHKHTDWANIGIYLFKGASLLQGLGKISNNNSQQEYYLTDVPKILKDEGKPVRVFHTHADMSVFTGINTQAHLAEALGHMRSRINARHMAAGVRMTDPSSVFIDDTVKISRGAVVYPGVILEGYCEIAENATIGANSHLTNTIVGAGAIVRQSVTVDAKIGANTDVGPFAYLRPGTIIGENCRVGNFVEVKNSSLGDGTKMSHLAYIGDADVGKNVNYGCGAITANYDGTTKHRTIIGDNAFVGSNSNLIAPVEIGENGFVAAGSTITDNLPPCALGIARERQCVKLNWTNKDAKD